MSEKKILDSLESLGEAVEEVQSSVYSVETEVAELNNPLEELESSLSNKLIWVGSGVDQAKFRSAAALVFSLINAGLLLYLIHLVKS